MNFKLLSPVLFKAAFAASVTVPSIALSQIVQETVVGKPAEIIQLDDSSVSNLTNALYLHQWVHVKRNQYLEGSVVTLLGKETVTLQKMRVSLMQDGKVVTYDDTDIEGNFLLEKVVPGRYTMVAEGGNLLSVFSVVVLDEIAGKHLPSDIEVRVMSTDGSRVSEILHGQTMPKSHKDHMVSFLGRDPIDSNRKILDSHQVQLSADGVLVGQLGKAGERVDMSSMTVFVTKDGKEVRRAKVGANGRFSVVGVAPGCYGFIAAGEQGIAATAFCAVSSDVAMVNLQGEKFVSAVQAPPTSLNVELGEGVPGTGDQSVVQDDTLGAPIVPPGMGPGFGGGAGGGGGFAGGGAGAAGGAGIGRLLLIGGAVAAAAVIAADDDDDTPASPIVP